MKTRFMVTSICLVLVLAVLPLAAYSQGGGSFKPVSAAPMSVTKPETPGVVNPSITSSYDGIYSGTFNYEYQEDRLAKVPGGPPYPVVVLGKEWIPASFRLTVTLKTVETGYEAVSGILVDITSVTCSDPNFGTGLSGVTPVPEKSGGTLPLDPPTTPMNPSKFGQGIIIYFPNDASLTTSLGDLQVSLGGQTLSGSAWGVRIPQEEGPLSRETLKYEDGSPSNYPRYRVNFKSWSLTRIAHSGLTTTTKSTEVAVLTGIYEDIEGERASISAIKAELRNAGREELEKALEEIYQYGQEYWLDPTNIYYNLLSQVRANQLLREIPPEEIEGYEFVGRTITKLSIQWAEHVQAFGWADDPEMLNRVIGEMKVKNAMLEEGTEISDHYRKLEGEASAVTSPTERAKLTDISGDVEVRKGGAGEWTKDAQTVLKSGDEIRTGENSKVAMEYPSGDRIEIGTETHVKVQDDLELLTGKIKASIQKKSGEDKKIRTPTAVTSVRGTEFTVSVDEDGTTTVMVLEGFVEVQDRTSNAGILLASRQMVTIPKIPGGLTEQDMLGRVTLVWPESIDRWWEEKTYLPPESSPVVPAPSGIGTMALVAVAATVIVAALVFALLLRRRHGRRRVPVKETSAGNSSKPPQ